MDENPPSSFSDWLVTTGRAIGYTTNTALARALGIPQPTVSRWKAGSKPSVEHLVKISDLFGIELKTLLILSGHMKGEVSPGKLAPPPSEAERMIAESPMEESLKKVLRDFWKERMREERDRLQNLIQGTLNAVSPTGGLRSTELDPWIEKAMETGLPWQVQRLKDSLAKAPKPYTWFISGAPDAEANPRELFHRTVQEGDEVQVNVIRGMGFGGFFPYISDLNNRWHAVTDNFETEEEAAEAIRSFLDSYPTLTYEEWSMTDAPEA